MAKTKYPQSSDRDHMMNPDAWFNWPYLTIKKPGGVCGLLLVDEGKYKIAEDANIFRLSDPKQKLNWKPTTVDAVLAAGWRVD